MFDIIDKDGNIIENYEGKIYRFIMKNEDILYLVFDRENYELRAVALCIEYSTEELVRMINDPNGFGIPSNLNEFYKYENDTRDLKVTFYNPGGNSKGNALGGKIVLPTSWLKIIGLSENDRSIKVSFDGEEIRIKKR